MYTLLLIVLWPAFVIYYSIRNVLLYQLPRERVGWDQVDLLDEASGLTDSRRQFTEIILTTAGLRLNGHSIPLVYLTPYQRRIKALVREHGFIAGL